MKKGVKTIRIQVDNPNFERIKKEALRNGLVPAQFVKMIVFNHMNQKE